MSPPLACSPHNAPAATSFSRRDLVDHNLKRVKSMSQIEELQYREKAALKKAEAAREENGKLLEMVERLTGRLKSASREKELQQAALSGAESRLKAVKVSACAEPPPTYLPGGC